MYRSDAVKCLSVSACKLSSDLKVHVKNMNSLTLACTCLSTPTNINAYHIDNDIHVYTENITKSLVMKTSFLQMQVHTERIGKDLSLNVNNLSSNLHISAHKTSKNLMLNTSSFLFLSIKKLI